MQPCGARVEKGWLMVAPEGNIALMVTRKTAMIKITALFSAGLTALARTVLDKGC
jgi:hypothetical protein